MTENWTDITRFSIALFALLNPFTCIPWVLYTAGPSGNRGVLVLAASSTAAVMAVLLCMHWAGQAILVTLGTSLPSFEIGGGLVILLGGLAMLQDEPAADGGAAKAPSTTDLVKAGVAPLGMPLLAGAGAMAKVIIETHPGFGIESGVVIAAIIVIVSLVSGLVIASSGLLLRILGPAFFSVVSRISGLIIVAVAVEVMSQGVIGHVRTIAHNP